MIGALLVAVGCGAPTPSAAHLLALTKAKVDATQALHFRLSGSDVSGTGPLITGGAGDAKRPDAFRGTLKVQLASLLLNVDVVSVGGTFYVKLPTDAGFTTADPSTYGFGDPAVLLDPDRGLSSLLLKCHDTQLGTTDRFNGEELYEVRCSLPGAPVAALLTSADKSQDVAATFGIDTQNDELRRVVLTGPFFSAHKRSTFTLVLDKYGENVSIGPPAGT